VKSPPPSVQRASPRYCQAQVKGIPLTCFAIGCRDYNEGKGVRFEKSKYDASPFNQRGRAQGGACLLAHDRSLRSRHRSRGRIRRTFAVGRWHSQGLRKPTSSPHRRELHRSTTACGYVRRWGKRPIAEFALALVSWRNASIASTVSRLGSERALNSRRHRVYALSKF
jgi:hypothetical protein